jgi:hypothetical protein
MVMNQEKQNQKPKSADETVKDAEAGGRSGRETNFGDDPEESKERREHELGEKPKERNPGEEVYDPASNPNIQGQPSNQGNTVEMTATDIITNAQAEAAGQDPPIEPPQNVGSPAAAGYLSPEAALAKFGGDGVRMNFPSSIVYLNTDHGIVAYPQGIHEVPKKLASHAYLKSSGVTEVKDPPAHQLDPAQPGNAPKTAPAKK